MGFADKYFKRVKSYNHFYSLELIKIYKLVVVIPCYNEPDFLLTLKSLFDNIFNDFNVLILVVVN
ncbi:MAG: hypothetical protein JXR68_10565, partial [Bacteroidales bacterium]|nr:hypothetical protein [Bacteroidales bacterium]